MSLPLLDVVTRTMLTPRRQECLAELQASLTFPSRDWVQTLLVDPHGQGVPATHCRLRTYEPAGRYVWVIDDDDACTEPELLSLIDETADLQLFRIRHCSFGTLPPDHLWGRSVELGHIGPPCAVVSRDLWMATRHAWGDRYEGDADFLRAAFRHAPRVVWTDRVVARIPDIGGGRR